MRKIMRNIARANMRKAGIRRANKPRYSVSSGMLCKRPSYFAENWRNFV